MARIGEDVSERLDVIPAQFRVLVTRRPKYACRRCSQAVAQAHAPEHVVPGGLPTELFIAWIIVSKFGDHLPFYRQAEIFRRQGIYLDRGTLGNWVGRACFHLMPVINHMRAHLRGADRIFVDETRAPVLDPGRKTTKSGCPMQDQGCSRRRRASGHRPDTAPTSRERPLWQRRVRASFDQHRTIPTLRPRRAAPRSLHL
jgi:transposase